MWTICDTCGALISDEQLHIEWHAHLQRTLEGIPSGD